ncbi:cell elongation-specific peptidoglycan biosynthesis regulator RodA [Nocardioides albertanoniae]|uniref:peptidoglycan glycosyltransferase n=1 Tax=Nocardioides albertanoniae TaxID=1175486 RepID=A0A543A1D1_9ACTN|nr:FtsW/RodA/SpoVE family cell cycle protein [Nocardioides albertanoniae]TQL66296.1 cell elongation-specific peptidoglycan biosynthesis regulator RodA [Nocardioides albertanoniae]
MSGFTPATSMPVFVHRSRRGAELVLMILALVVGVGAYAAVGLGVQEKIPVDIVGYGTWLIVILLAAHIGVRLMAPYADPVLLPLVAMLNGFGLAIIHRLDLAAGTNESDSFARQQLVWMTIGVVLFLITLFVVPDHRMLQRFTYTAGLAAVVMLILPMLPLIGKTINGARIWINLGPVSFQPGEVAKVMLVICFAGYLAVHRDALALAGRRIVRIDLPRGRDLGPLLMMWAISLAILVLQRDLGSSLLFYGLFVVTLYVATERKGWIVVGGLLFAGGVFSAISLFSHVRVRVLTWLDPFKYYPEPVNGTSSEQLVQGLFGMSWGGMIGRGFGSGQPWRIPYANSDFIFPAIGEELGLTALLALLLCYGLIVERGLRTAIVARDDFGKLLSVGLATSIALQTFVVVGGVTGLIPLTGLTTPFLSYGGSSLVANWVIVALLLRVSDQSRRPLPTAPSDEDLAAEETQIVKLDKGAMKL